MSFLTLFVIFFKVGLFTIGGGLASLGLLHEYLVEPGYLDPSLFYNMVAISQSTPGPIGINMATYIGFEYAGISGAIVATLSLVLPSFIIISLLAFTLKNFKDNKYVVSAFSGFRPAAISIILSVAYMIITNSVIDLDSSLTVNSSVIIKVIICILTVVLSLKFKVHPILCIVGGGLIGAFLL